MTVAVNVRRADALAVRVAGVAVVARAAVLRRVVVERAGFALRPGPFVAARAGATSVGVPAHSGGVAAAVDGGAGQVAARVGVVSARTRVAVAAGEVAWARRAGRSCPLIPASAGAGSLDPADTGSVVVAIDGAGAKPTASRIVGVSTRAG